MIGPAMKLTRTFKISGALVLLGVLLLVVRAVAGWEDEPWVPLGVILLVFSAPVFAVSATRHLMRGLLWRVGSRLLVSYLLIILIPLPFGLLLVWAGVYAATGQFAARRLEVVFEVALTDLEAAATPLFDRVAEARDEREVLLLLDDARRRLALPLPDLSAAWHSAGGSASVGPLSAGLLAPRDWFTAQPSRFATEIGDDDVLGVAVRRPAGTLVLALPIRDPLLARLESQTDIVIEGLSITRISSDDTGAGAAEAPEPPASGSDRDGKLTIKKGDRTITVSTGSPATSAEAPADGEKKERETAARPVGSGPLLGRWVVWGSRFERPVVDWSSGAPLPDDRIGVALRTSIALEYRRLFGRTPLTRSAEATDVGTLVLKTLRGFGWATLIAELLATLVAAILVARIARATRRLAAAFGEIEKGNFAHRARLGGKDQLAVLIGGFNRMAEHLEESVALRAERETLDRELRLARDLQRRLLPSPDFAFPGVEISADFRPAAAIGGDFYHFVAEGSGTLVVVIADVSGHGLPTGIVMASAKASLSALSSTGADTTAILTTLDEEIRRTTDRRTFVTLAHSRLRLADGRLELTNAGHLYPYRVTADGVLSTVENPSRPLGVGLPAEFSSVSSPLAPGDLWVFYSDGIVEAVDGDGEPFGFERLEALLRDSAGSSARELRDRILERWRAHTGGDEPEDDRTLLVVRILPRA